MANDTPLTPENLYSGLNYNITDAFKLKSHYTSAGNNVPVLFNENKLGLLTFNKGVSDGTVPGKIWFVPEGDFSSSLTFDTKNLYETVSNGAAGFSPVKSLTKGIAALTGNDSYASAYTNIPEQTGFKAGINGSIKLNFRYGLLNQYDSKKEVVDPIFNIVKFFSPYYSGKKVRGPYASSGRVLIHMLDNLLKGNDANYNGNNQENGGAGDISSLLNPPQSADGQSTDINIKESYSKIVQALDNLTKSVITAFDSAVSDTLNDLDFRTCNIKIGMIEYKYLFVGGLNWQFDTNNVDQKGYPTKGFVELNNLAYIFLPANGKGQSFMMTKASNDKNAKDKYQIGLMPKD